MSIRAPESLASTHQLDGFSCGEPVLDEWLIRRALANQTGGASRTFVVTDNDRRVLGYYALAAGAVERAASPGNIRRNMPEPIPVFVLGRLAVDRKVQGTGLGAALLKDAVTRASRAAHEVGARALLVHALNGRARDFYLAYGFQMSPLDPLTLMLRLG